MPSAMSLAIIIYQPPRHLRAREKTHEPEPKDAPKMLLPEDLVPLLCSLLKARELGKVAQLNRAWKWASERDEYWERLCVDYFHVRSSSLKPPPSPVKRLFEVQVIALQRCLQGLRGPMPQARLPAVHHRFQAW